MATGDPRCQLPEELTRSLQEIKDFLPPANVTEGRLDPMGLAVRCFQKLHVLFAMACRRLFALPEVTGLLLQPVGFVGQGWRSSVAAWAQAQRQHFFGWGRRYPECVAPSLQLRISSETLEDYAEQTSVLAGIAQTVASSAAARRWLYRFQSSWSMALYYLTCLQYFSLSAFSATSDLAFQMHRHRYAHMSVPAAFDEISDQLPRFRFVRSTPLRHDELAAAAVLAALRQRIAQGGRAGPPVRLAEVGVFRANLSSHIWRRAGFCRGRRLEMHLVDHWGTEALTGSNMAGTSNSSLFLTLVRRFSKLARTTRVPYGLPRRAARAAVERGGDVFFHRTTSVGAAHTFDAESLDVVYIDADHKWWSVLQDIAAWWPKVRPGGVMLGHDFHLNSLMEREGDAGGDSNDVPMAVLSFFRHPAQITLHSGFVWSVEKPSRAEVGVSDGASGISLPDLCGFLRERLAPHWEFEVCPDA